MAIKQQIKIKCLLQLFSGQTIPGVTRNLGMDGAFMECHFMNPPQTGESAMITLNLIRSKQTLSLRTSCRIISVQPDGLEIAAQFSYMAKNDVECLKIALANKSVEID